MNRNSQPCALWRNYSPAPLDKQLCKTAIFGLSFAPPKILSAGAPDLHPTQNPYGFSVGAPDSAVENAVIRMRYTTALVKPRYLDEVLPHRKCFRWGPQDAKSACGWTGAY